MVSLFGLLHLTILVGPIADLRFAADAKWTLIVPEQRKQKDDRQGNSEQPEQKSTTKAHVYLLS
jgi:hypothetical protein